MRGAWAALRGAYAELWANPRALGLQVVIMVVNDLAWIGFWWVFFQRVGSVRGWDFDAVLLLWASLATVAGLVLGLLGNARRIAWLVLDGGLDAVLSLPVHPLPYLLLRRIDATFVGDVVFGVALFAVTGDPTPERVLRFVVAVACGTLLLAGFLVLVESAVFFNGSGRVGELGFDAVVLLASYPVDVFSGVARLALYTLVPAAFVAAVPARFVDRADLGTGLSLLAAGVAFATLGWAAFTFGLRRYTSGSAWVRP